MVHILTNGWYPPHKAMELVKIYVGKDKPAYPDFLKKIHHWGVVAETGDYKTIAVYECPDDKLVEALKALFARYDYYTQVVGYKFSIDPLFDAEEAIKAALGK